MIVKAKQLRHGNRVKMDLIGSESSLFFPVESPQLIDGKISCTIHKTKFEFDPEQDFMVMDKFLGREQLRSKYRIDNITFYGEDKVKGEKKKVREYVGRMLDGNNQTLSILIERDTGRKFFNIVQLPSWMPNDAEIKRDLIMAKSWKAVEKILYAHTGADVHSKGSVVDTGEQIESIF